MKFQNKNDHVKIAVLRTEPIISNSRWLAGLISPLKAICSTVLIATLIACGGGGTSPTTSVTSAAPAVPTAPVVPAVPAVPTPPVVPAAPAVPTPPVVPAAPAVPTPPVVPAAPTTPTVPAAPTVANVAAIANTGRVSIQGQKLGVVFLQVMREDQVAITGEAYEGALTVNYGNSDGSNIIFTSIDGVVRNLVKNVTGQWVFQVEATNLVPGNYEYSIQAKDSKTNETATFVGTVKVVQPIEVKSGQLSSAGLTINLTIGEVKFSPNNLAGSANVTVKVIPIQGGVRYLVTSPISFKDSGIKISLPGIENPTIISAISNQIRAFRLAVDNFFGNDNPKLNYSPYANTPVYINGSSAKDNFSDNSLGTLLKQGDPDQVFQSGPDIVAQRIWDNPTPYAGNPDNNWQIPWEAVKTIRSNVSYLASYDQYSAWELHSSIIGDPAKFDWANHEPVLFIHGFAPTYGGGEGTWGSFPKLALQTTLPNGKMLVPFEFRWRTSQSFRLAADDLASAIAEVYRVSGRKPVHVVAHSFGGVLTRVLIQEMSKIPARGAVAKTRVASLMTVGSPHSGIASSNKTVGGVPLPKGAFQSVDIIATCQSISCYEVGGDAGLLSLNPGAYFQNVGLTGEYATKGMLTAKLNDTAVNLPAIPIYQGIGMQKALIGANVVDGDGLISFAGQRFLARSNNDDLLYQKKVGQANVTEVILGFDPKIRAGGVVGASNLPTKRAAGYAHSSISGLANGNIGVSDAGFAVDRGLEAAPSFECNVPASCTHASYLLFRQLQNDKFNLSNIAYAYENQLPPQSLQVKRNLGLTPDQQRQAQLVLDDLVSKKVISGKNINWNKLTYEQQSTSWVTLRSVPNSTAVRSLLSLETEAKQSLNAYYVDRLKSDNVASGLEGLFGDRALLDWLKIAGAEVKAVKGVISAVYPAAAFAADAGAVTLNGVAGVSNVVDKLILLSRLETFLKIMNDCPLVYTEYKTAIAALAAGSNSGENLLKAITLPMTCFSSALEPGGDEAAKFAKLVKVLSDTVNLADGTKVSVIQLNLDLVDFGLALMPKSINLLRVKGLVDVISAGFDSYLAGQKMAERGDKAYILLSNELEATSNSWDQKLQASRIQVLLTAKGADLFEADPSLAVLNISNSTPTIQQLIQLSISNAVSRITSVIWSFADTVTTATSNVINGISVAVIQSFTSSGPKSITATFKDTAGNTVGQSVATVNVIPTARILGAISDSPNQPGAIANGASTNDTTPTLNGTISAPLASGQKVNVYDGATQFAAVAVVNGTSWSFTPATPLVGGLHSFTAEAATFDGTPGVRSAPFVINVLATRVMSVTPAAITRTLAVSLNIAGIDLPTSGLVVSVPGDARAICQTPANLTTNSFTVSCQLYMLGTQTLEIRSGARLVGTTPVLVNTNVTGVTWSSPNTTSSGTVRFGEQAIFSVAGVNLLADPGMGFAVQNCGVSNTEIGTPSNTLRIFTCNFNNQSGAVAGQMPGVVKDSPSGQVLFDGWNVPVETALVQGSTTLTTGRLNDTGITSSQCYAGGGDVGGISCSSAVAIALNSKQDGMIGRDVSIPLSSDGKLGFSFSTVVGGCVKDNVTGLTWEAKTADSGVRDYRKNYTNYGDNRLNDASAFVFYINQIALCGFTDWRLPKRLEIFNLLDLGADEVKIDRTWFPNIGSGLINNNTSFSNDSYWTGTKSDVAGDSPWLIDLRSVVVSTFQSGFDGSGSKLGVMLVRGSEQLPALFSPKVSGAEVFDSTSGLTWQRCLVGQTWNGNGCIGDPITPTFEGALQIAARQSGWRLPNIKEASTLTRDSNRGIISIDVAAFPTQLFANDRNRGGIWSATPNIGFPRGIFTLRLENGVISPSAIWENRAMKLVRD